MHPELKAYLDGYHARAMARFDAVDRQNARMLKILTGVSSPQPACPMGTAADGGLTDDASIPAVVPDVFSATTQAQEALPVAHDVPSVCIEMAPVTCSTECPTQVATLNSVDEVHDGATTAHLEHVVDLIHQEVPQLTPVPSIGTNTTSTAAVVAPVATTTTDDDSKTSVLELDASPLPSINTSTPVASERDHSVVLIVPNNFTALAPTKYSKECLTHVGDWVKPLTTTVDSADETHDTAIAEHPHLPSFEHQPWPPPVQVQIRAQGSMSRPCPWPLFDRFHEESLRCHQGVHLKLLCSSFSSNCQAVQLWSDLPTVEFQFSAHGPTDPNLMRESWWCLQKITYKGSHMEHLFRPRQWWSLKYDSVAGYLEEPSSGTHHQSHEVSGFSVELVPLPFSDVSSPQVPYRQPNSMEESFCCLPGTKLQSGRPPDRATTGNIIHMPPVRVRISHMGHLFRPRPWPSFKYHSNDGYPAEPYSGIHNQPHGVSWFSARLVLFSFRDEDFILVCCGELIPMEEPFICLLPCETSYGFYWEMLALAVEILKEHLLLQPKPQWSAIALTKIDTYDTSTSNFGVHLVGSCLIMIEPELCADLISYQVKPGLHPLCMSASRALLVLIFDWPLSSERELIAGTMAISTEKLLQSSSFQCDQTCYLESGSTQACLKLNGVCATAVFLFEGYLSIWSELHIVVHEQVRQWAWCFYLEKSWSIRYLACNSQERGKFYEHHILEYVAGGILIPDKLQETTQIMTVSVQWKILSKEQFKCTVSLVHQTCLTIKHTVSLQPCNSNTTVPCFACFASRSRQQSLFNCPSYQNDFLVGNLRAYPNPCAVNTSGDYNHQHSSVQFENLWRTGTEEVFDHRWSAQMSSVLRQHWDPGGEQQYPEDTSEYDGDILALLACLMVQHIRNRILMAMVISNSALAMSSMTFSTCYNQDHFQEGRRGIVAVDVVFAQGFIVHECRLSFDHNIYFNRASIGHDYYYLSPDCFSELIQDHLNHGCYRGNYHGDPGMIKDLQAPWDPGKLFVIAAWGQAAFQEGRDVRSLCVHGLTTSDHYMGRPIREPPSAAAYKCLGGGNEQGIRAWITALATPWHPLPFFLLSPSSSPVP